MLTDTVYSSSTYSIESTELDRQAADRRIQPELLGRQRSVTIDSATGSSVETVTGLIPWAEEHDRVLHITNAEESSQPSFTKPPNSPGHHTLSINQRPPAALARSSHLPHLPVRLDNREASREPASPASCYSTGSWMVSKTTLESGDGDCSRPVHPATPVKNPHPKELPGLPNEKQSSDSRPVSTDSANESLSPLQIRPRLIHHSPPPWSMGGTGRVHAEVCADQSICSGRGYSSGPEGAQTLPIEISPNHQFPHIRRHLKPSPRRSSAGLGKLFKSVKASLRSIPANGSTLDLPGSPASANMLHHQGSQQGWTASDQASSLKSVDVDCRTALAQQESPDPLDITMAHDQEQSNKPLPRSLSSCCSYSTIDSPTTSTSHSPSITPSSSLFSLPAAGSDCPSRNLSGSHYDLNVNRKTDPKGQLPLLINPLDAGQPHSPSTTGSPNMSTQTAFVPAPPSASCFGNSFVSNNIHVRREHPKLKLKASFGFLNNIKRAVGGTDTSLSFSFPNNSTTFLTANTISLPVGTVLRNNGMDPLPHCYPLPLKPSQSSPSSLNYPASLPPRLEQAAHYAPPAQHLPLSTSNPDFFDDQQGPQWHAPKPNISVHPPEFQRRTEEGSLHPQSSQRRTDESTLHPARSASNVTKDAPTLNLRPVSLPFAASFSDRFLSSDHTSAAPSAESQKLYNARRKQRKGTDHEDHCSCCSSLASENDALKNRIKQLESHIYRSQASKSKKVAV